MSWQRKRPERKQANAWKMAKWEEKERESEYVRGKQATFIPHLYSFGSIVCLCGHVSRIRIASMRWVNGELCYINPTSPVFKRQINYWNCSHKYLCDYIYHSPRTIIWSKAHADAVGRPENMLKTPFHLAGVRCLHLHRFLAIIHC